MIGLTDTQIQQLIRSLKENNHEISLVCQEADAHTLLEATIIRILKTSFDKNAHNNNPGGKLICSDEKSCSDEIFMQLCQNKSMGISSQPSDEIQRFRNPNFQRLQVSQQGATDLAIIVVAMLLFGFLIFSIIKFLKKKKQNNFTQNQLKNENLKFLPRVAIPSDRTLNESNSRLSQFFSFQKAVKNFEPNTKILSPSNKNVVHTLKLEEDNHPSSVINENIFTNIDNSPKSQAPESPSTSVRNTPKDINFNIEFSILEKTPRD